jgi:hypothetical protein
MSHLFLSRNIEDDNAWRTGPGTSPSAACSTRAQWRTGTSSIRRAATCTARSPAPSPSTLGPTWAPVAAPACSSGAASVAPCNPVIFDWDFPMRRLFLSRKIEGATDAGSFYTVEGGWGVFSQTGPAGLPSGTLTLSVLWGAISLSSLVRARPPMPPPDMNTAPAPAPSSSPRLCRPRAGGSAPDRSQSQRLINSLGLAGCRIQRQDRQGHGRWQEPGGHPDERSDHLQRRPGPREGQQPHDHACGGSAPGGHGGRLRHLRRHHALPPGQQRSPWCAQPTCMHACVHAANAPRPAAPPLSRMRRGDPPALLLIDLQLSSRSGRASEPLPHCHMPCHIAICHAPAAAAAAAAGDGGANGDRYPRRCRCRRCCLCTGGGLPARSSSIEAAAGRACCAGGGCCEPRESSKIDNPGADEASPCCPPGCCTSDSPCCSQTGCGQSATASKPSPSLGASVLADVVVAAAVVVVVVVAVAVALRETASRHFACQGRGSRAALSSCTIVDSAAPAADGPRSSADLPAGRLDRAARASTATPDVAVADRQPPSLLHTPCGNAMDTQTCHPHCLHAPSTTFRGFRKVVQCRVHYFLHSWPVFSCALAA